MGTEAKAALPLRRSASGGKAAASTARRGLVLGLLVALALCVSFSNLLLGRSAAKLQRMHQPNNPKLERIETFQKEDTGERRNERPLAMNNGDGRVYDGDTLAQIMKGKRKFPRGRNRLRYRPGTLDMPPAEALRYCYVNATIYKNHTKEGKQSLVSLSDRHKLIYRNIPKSSSSSARHAMQDYLDGEDSRMKHDTMEELVHRKRYQMISFIRDPLNRFYSSYDEAFFRMGPWMLNGPIVRDKPRIRQAYNNSKWRVEKYPYLYEGFDTIDDFRQLYCPAEVLATGRFLDCNGIPSIDDGNLAHRFEQFVRDYSGLDPFDIHLNLQMGSLIFPTGEPFPVTKLYNATDAEKGWQEVAGRRGVEIPDGEMTHGRKITRRFNVSLVSKEAKRKICRLLALDYCCLNMQLPKVCREAGEDEAVYCSWSGGTRLQCRTRWSPS
ncbi:hypothetical protein ACHAXT_011186 [Thalassiosira profunda]